jgi:hypothetical protein
MKLHKYVAFALAGLAISPLAAHATTLSLLFSYEDPNGAVNGDFTLGRGHPGVTPVNPKVITKRALITCSR